MPRFKKELEAALPALWRYAFALTRERTLADDLVQDCLERALRKRDLWDQARPIQPWLARMALNIHRNQFKSSARAQYVAYDEDMAGLQAAASSEQELQAKDMLRRVDALPADQREILLLVVIDGLSYAQAAEVLSIPVGTVMSRISRARAALKQDPQVRAARGRLRSVT